jgi:hypothetical protein
MADHLHRNAHSIIGQITIAELRAELSELHAVNGFANRVLYALAKRSKSLAFGGNVSAAALSDIAARLSDAIKHGPGGRIDFDEATRPKWPEIYDKLSAGQHGIFGAITNRAEAQIVRVALLYALLDQQSQIGIAHLEAAQEIIRYSNDSAKHIFGDATGNRVADAILRELRAAAPGVLTRSEINADIFGRNIKADNIAAALNLLLSLNLIQRSRNTSTNGRPSESYRAT